MSPSVSRGTAWAGLVRRGAFAALATVLSLSACSGGAADSGDPAEAVETMMRALDSGDCAAVKRVVVTPSEIDCGFVTDLRGMFADEEVDLDAVDFTVAESAQDQATVEIDWKDGNPAETYEVQKVDGAWKVLFDSAA